MSLDLNIDQILEAAESKMRSGERSEARRLLLLLKDHAKGRSLVRAKRSAAASLARRAGLLPLAMQIMSPIVRPKTPLSPPLTAEELATYGLILLGLGAHEECDHVLNQADPTHPEVLIAKAFAKIRTWNYREAIGYLESYIQNPTLNSYQRMIAMVNLAASLVAVGELQRGRSLLETILVETKKAAWSLLHRNGLELLAQIAVQEDRLQEAREILEKLASTEDDLFVQKWLTIARLRETPNSQLTQDATLALQSHAARINHWETVRDCDYHLALARKDPALMLKVYFGTPYRSYRERIRETTSDWLKIPSTYSMTLLGLPPPSRVFDLRSASEVHPSEVDRSDVRLPKERVLHKALKTLTSDLYRPFMVGSLHSSIYPGEHFNYASSPQRIAFLIHRLRAWLDENGIPLDILNNRDGYRLAPDDQYGFQYHDHLRQDDVTAQEPTQYQLYHVWLESLSPLKGKAFSVHDVAAQLQIADRTARYFLSWATEESLLQRLGAGRGIRYRFSDI